MRCVAYCLGTHFQLLSLARSYRQRGYRTEPFRGVLQVQSPEGYIVFYFQTGALVMWGLKKHQEQNELATAKRFISDPLTEYEHDQFSYQYGEISRAYSHDRFKIDCIELENETTAVKLALSYGLAQSVKLESYESTVLRLVASNQLLPQELARTGKIGLSRRAISKRMGQIFLARSSINLTSEYLDTPEFFWEHPHLEAKYEMMKHFLELPGRVQALNQRLDVLHETLDILNSELHHRHSSQLEITIIILIFIEIVINLIHNV